MAYELETLKKSLAFDFYCSLPFKPLPAPTRKQQNSMIY